MVTAGAVTPLGAAVTVAAGAYTLVKGFAAAREAIKWSDREKLTVSTCTERDCDTSATDD